MAAYYPPGFPPEELSSIIGSGPLGPAPTDPATASAPGRAMPGQGAGQIEQPQKVQWSTPLIEVLKPMLEGSAETLASRMPPPPLPPGMTRSKFGRLLGWSKSMEAQPWAEQIAKDPSFAKQIIDNLKKNGLAKDHLGQWSRWYQGNYDNPAEPAPQFQFRSQGLRQLQDQYSGVGPITPVVPPASTCPTSWLCS